MTKTKNTQISEKNTKQQILNAYNEMLKQQEQQQISNPQKEQQIKMEQQIVKRATSESTETIIQGVAKLKVDINQSLNSLGENLTAEFKKLEYISSAIKLEQKHLEELYQIKDTANTLSALICTQDEMKREFERKVQERRSELEKEGTEKRDFWEIEQERLEAQFKERKQEIEKSRKREEEEYEYNLLHTRQKEQDKYNVEKIAKEKELVEREKQIADKEQEVEQLQQKVEQFDEQLESSVDAAKKSLEYELTSKYEFATKLSEKEIEGERNLRDQRIAALEARIKDQDMLIKQLTEKSNQASQQVQEIANRALDTSGSRIVSYPVSDVANRDDKKSA